MDQVFSFARWVGAKVVFCSVLLEESRSVTVDIVGEGEKKISLSNLQHFILQSWVNEFFEVHLGEF